MAIKQWSIGNVDDNKLNVVPAVGPSIGTDAVRVIIDETYAINKTQALLALEAIRQRIVEDAYPFSTP